MLATVTASASILFSSLLTVHLKPVDSVQKDACLSLVKCPGRPVSTGVKRSENKAEAKAKAKASAFDVRQRQQKIFIYADVRIQSFWRGAMARQHIEHDKEGQQTSGGSSNLLLGGLRELQLAFIERVLYSRLAAACVHLQRGFRARHVTASNAIIINLDRSITNVQDRLLFPSLDHLDQTDLLKTNFELLSVGEAERGPFADI